MKIERGKKNIDKQAIEMAGILRPINEKLSDQFVEISIEEDGRSKAQMQGIMQITPVMQMQGIKQITPVMQMQGIKQITR